MTRNAPALTTEQADLADLVGAVIAGTKERVSDEYPEEVATIRRHLGELGVWTLGASPDGAGDDLAAIAFACLGRSWSALAWAAVQAHAAVEVLGDVEITGAIRVGDTPVAVVDDASVVVRLTVQNGRISGRIDRIEPAGERPHVVVLGERQAYLFPPEVLRFGRVRRTGLDGALTMSAEVIEPVREADVAIAGVDTTAARIRLRLGAAAVAAGIADAAAQAALAYSAQREQFGAALTALPTVRDSLFTSAAAAATTLRLVLRLRDCSAWQAAAVLDTACEQAIDTCARAVQAHGGYGYLTEYEVGRMLCDAVSLRAACDVAGARRTSAADLVGHSDSRRDAR